MPTTIQIITVTTVTAKKPYHLPSPGTQVFIPHIPEIKVGMDKSKVMDVKIFIILF